ncbi:hypothetical protein [Oryza sativa Japonica Group]|uniref:Uncharacterized protein n=1 Tax=Oryza sativa subsp. japonica TaxID=39947 RepID=Q5QM78_ORYSJ|nr:hypothetical protein [Oryza sativa Japonica Group]
MTWSGVVKAHADAMPKDTQSTPSSAERPRHIRTTQPGSHGRDRMMMLLVGGEERWPPPLPHDVEEYYQARPKQELGGVLNSDTEAVSRLHRGADVAQLMRSKRAILETWN